jgi:hypothetical protein
MYLLTVFFNMPGFPGYQEPAMGDGRMEETKVILITSDEIIIQWSNAAGKKEILLVEGFLFK